jgi:hypothetical protein
MDAVRSAKLFISGQVAGEHRMTRQSLESLSRKDLAELAKKRGVVGWQELKKEELISRIMRRADRGGRSRAGTTSRSATRRESSTRKPRQGVTGQRAPAGTNSKPAVAKPNAMSDRAPEVLADVPDTTSTNDLASLNGTANYTKDRVVLMVRDPFWLHAYWEITLQSMQRAEAALGQDWHTAKPILRVVDVSSQDTTSTSEAIVRDIEIQGGCQNWYINVSQPPRSYRVDVGYLSRRGQFFVLSRSNVVTTPKAGAHESLDDGWDESNFENGELRQNRSASVDHQDSIQKELKHILDDRLSRSLGATSLSYFGSGVSSSNKKPFDFRIEAELIIFGETAPDARVTLQGEAVKLRPDGTFTMRFSLPDSRQIIPAVAVSANGAEERTIVLAVERNTKYLEPIVHDPAEEE